MVGKNFTWCNRYVYEPEHLSATYMKVDDYILPILDGVLKCM